MGRSRLGFKPMAATVRAAKVHAAKVHADGGKVHGKAAGRQDAGQSDRPKPKDTLTLVRRRPPEPCPSPEQCGQVYPSPPPGRERTARPPSRLLRGATTPPPTKARPSGGRTNRFDSALAAAMI
jgi:hypothetical protein